MLGTIRDGKKCPLNEGVASVKEYVPGSWEAFNTGTKIYVLGNNFVQGNDLFVFKFLASITVGIRMALPN